MSTEFIEAYDPTIILPLMCNLGMVRVRYPGEWKDTFDRLYSLTVWPDDP